MHPSADDDPLVEIQTTFAARDAAAACAERLVGRGLAACVQIDGPVCSTYRWQGRVETAEEWRCTCKTTATRSVACVAAIVATHPYENPEVLVRQVTGTPAYAAWVRESVTES
jgi:periplasmic divalent cation tolerance protein